MRNAGQPNSGILITPMTIRVVLKDIEMGTEKVIFTRTVQQKFIQINRGPTISFGFNWTGGGVSLARTSDGCLAVAVANSAQIEIYDGGGERVRSFTIAKTARPATSNCIARYKKAQIEGIRKQWENIPDLRNAVKDIEGYDFSKFFDEPLPIFTDMQIDADGNFLFFLSPEDPGEPGLDLYACSSGGELIAETRLDPGPFEVRIDQRFRRLRFAKTGLIGLARLKDDADELPVLFRVVPGAIKS